MGRGEGGKGTAFRASKSDYRLETATGPYDRSFPSREDEWRLGSTLTCDRMHSRTAPKCGQRESQGEPPRCWICSCSKREHSSSDWVGQRRTRALWKDDTTLGSGLKIWNGWLIWVRFACQIRVFMAQSWRREADTVPTILPNDGGHWRQRWRMTRCTRESP